MLFSYFNSYHAVLVAEYRSNQNDIWAASWQNQQNGMCAQRRLRSSFRMPRLIWAFVGRTAILLKHAPRMIWVLAWRTCHFLGFVMSRLNYDYTDSGRDNGLHSRNLCIFIKRLVITSVRCIHQTTALKRSRKKGVHMLVKIFSFKNIFENVFFSQLPSVSL